MYIPTQHELLREFPYLTPEIADEILNTTSIWIPEDDAYRLQVIEYLIYQLHRYGVDIWEELRWDTLVEIIRSRQIRIYDALYHLLPPQDD